MLKSKLRSLRKFYLVTLGLLPYGVLFFPKVSYAHENYVLTKEQINGGVKDFSINVFSTLSNPGNLKIALLVGLGSFVVIVLYFFFQHSRSGIWLDGQLNKLEGAGHVVLRLALAASFIFSAHTLSYLGPEISVFSLPGGTIIRLLLYILGFALILGIFTELVSIISLGILLLATYVYKDYMLTYFNYFGEFIALIIFGSRIFSLDRLFFGVSKLQQKYKKYEIAIIRTTYGISILYPAISIKLLHPIIIVDIVNQYNLTQFHWLFPRDPVLISLGSGLAQVAVGIAIIAGFQTRLNSLVTFSLMILSVIFFKEAVWPHYILLALALYLVINNGGEFSLDAKIRNYILNKRTSLQSNN